jgi:hypothetical protein
MAKLQVVMLVAALVFVLLINSMKAEPEPEPEPFGDSYGQQAPGQYQQAPGQYQQGYRPHSFYRRRREVNANSNNGQWDPKLHGTGKGSEPFAPVTGPKSFKVNVADGIQGANQLRQETWDKGAVQGMYSHPVGNGKWQIVNYVADDKGFRVTSTKLVDEAEIQQGSNPGNQKANVDIESNGDKASWTVSADQLGKKSKDNSVVKERRDSNDKDKDHKDSKDAKDAKKDKSKKDKREHDKDDKDDKDD